VKIGAPTLRHKKLLILTVFVMLSGSIYWTYASKNERYIFRSTYKFENRGDAPFQLIEDDATILLFIKNTQQKITVRNSTHKVAREYEDEDGNLLAVLDFPEMIPNGGSLYFSFEYIIDSKDIPKPTIDPQQSGYLSDIPKELIDKFCIETETFRWCKDMVTLAKDLTNSDKEVLEKVTKILGWILENITYGNFEVPQYPDETLDKRRGDCDDQSILLISMLRSLGIPAHLQIGVVFSDTIEGDRTSWEDHLRVEQKGIGWHGWAMVYIPPWGWLPIDITLTGSQDPLTIIKNSPQYESYVIAAYNVSKKAYIGESRKSRERIVTSDLYVSISDTVIYETIDNSSWISRIYILSGFMAGTAFIVYLLYIRRSIK
jgi:hypothetical protein